MGHNLRWDTLEDYSGRDANLYAHCYICGRTATFSGRALLRYFQSRGWPVGIATVYRKLKCRRCNRPVDRVGPSRRAADTGLPS